MKLLAGCCLLLFSVVGCRYGGPSSLIRIDDGHYVGSEIVVRHRPLAGAIARENTNVDLVENISMEAVTEVGYYGRFIRVPVSFSIVIGETGYDDVHCFFYISIRGISLTRWLSGCRHPDLIFVGLTFAIFPSRIIGYEVTEGTIVAGSMTSGGAGDEEEDSGQIYNEDLIRVRSDYIPDLRATSLKVFGGQKLAKEALLFHRRFIEGIRGAKSDITFVGNIDFAARGGIDHDGESIHYSVVFDMALDGRGYRDIHCIFDVSIVGRGFHDPSLDDCYHGGLNFEGDHGIEFSRTEESMFDVRRSLRVIPLR